jgi:hypothetical protein
MDPGASQPLGAAPAASQNVAAAAGPFQPPQVVLRPSPRNDFLQFVALWLGVSTLLLLVVVLLVAARWRSDHNLAKTLSEQNRELTEKVAQLEVELAAARLAGGAGPGIPGGMNPEQLMLKIMSDPQLMGLATKLATQHAGDLQKVLSGPEGQKLIELGVEALRQSPP